MEVGLRSFAWTTWICFHQPERSVIDGDAIFSWRSNAMVSVICCTCQSTCAVVTPIMCIRARAECAGLCWHSIAWRKESMFAVSCIRALTGRTRADRASSLLYGNSCSRRTGVCSRLKVRMLAVNAGPHWHASHSRPCSDGSAGL